jgi:hypothetical protein
MDTENDENKEQEPVPEPETEKKKNNWGGFLSASVSALITVLLIGLLGANFVYLTRINKDLFFPTDPTQRPYTDKNKQGNKLPPMFGKSTETGNINQSGGGDVGGCGIPIDIKKSKLFDNKYFRGTFEYGFPYSMESEAETFGGVISNWFSNKVKYSYIWLRTVEKSIITFFESFCAMTPESANDIVPFILGPIVIQLIFLITSIWYLPSLVSVFWNEDPNNKYGIWISILGLFLGWTWAVPMMTSFVQIFSTMFKFVLLPVMMNSKDIINIMGKTFNAWWLKTIFFAMVSAAAFKNLDLIIAIIMLIVFIPHFIPPGMNPLSKKK